jgi:broad specificity phosphatase PhoE
MELILIRHGESAHNIGASESHDSPLSALGLLQADAAGEALQGLGIERLACSLQLRGLMTADAIGRRLNIKPEAWFELSERGFSHTETGMPRSVMEKRFPDILLPDEADELGWSRHWTKENTHENAIRMGKVAARLRLMYEEGIVKKIACVVHQMSCAMLIRKIMGVEDASDAFFSHTNCGISLIEYSEKRTTLRKLNDTLHLQNLRAT